MDRIIEMLYRNRNFDAALLLDLAWSAAAGGATVAAAHMLEVL